MSDLKAMFAAAKAQRGTTASTKEQLRALRAQKAAAAAAAPKPKPAAPAAASAAAAAPAPAPRPPHPEPDRRMPPPPPRPPGGSSPAPGSPRGSGPHAHDGHARHAQPSATSSGSGLPAGFFDARGEPSSPSAANGIHGARDMPLSEVDVGPAADLPPGFFESVSAGTPPRASSSDSGGVLGHRSSSGGRGPHAAARENAAARDTAISRPKSGPAATSHDFFTNAAEGAKARGEPPRKKPKTAEEQMSDFMKSVEGDVRAAEEVEQAEAERFAEERTDREAFEQRQRLARIEALRQQKAAARAAAAAAPPGAMTISEPMPSGTSPAAAADEAGPSSGTAAAPAATAGSSVMRAVDMEAEVAISVDAIMAIAAQQQVQELEQRKRRRPAEAAADDMSEGDSDENSEDEGAAQLDWRAKAF